MVRTGATFADAAAEYLRYVGEDRVRKASTVEDYRSNIRVDLLPAFGDAPLETITAGDQVELLEPVDAATAGAGGPVIHFLNGGEVAEIELTGPHLWTPPALLPSDSAGVRSHRGVSLGWLG